jgi:hypothetical protein
MCIKEIQEPQFFTLAGFNFYNNFPNKRIECTNSGNQKINIVRHLNGEIRIEVNLDPKILKTLKEESEKAGVQPSFNDEESWLSFGKSNDTEKLNQFMELVFKNIPSNEASKKEIFAQINFTNLEVGTAPKMGWYK